MFELRGKLGAKMASVQKGIEFFNQGLYFAAHEIWEEAWNESEEPFPEKLGFRFRLS